MILASLRRKHPIEPFSDARTASTAHAPLPGLGLENQLECKLHRGWPPHRVKRTLDTKRVRQRGCCQPELVPPQKGANRAKVRMVEEVERLGSELELQVFIEGELPAYCQVHLPCAETSRK